MRNQTTLKITTGAMMIALFALLLIINRQTGSMFEEMLLFVMPLPMAAFCAKYDWQYGIPVMIAMVLMSFLFGTVTTIFYAGTEALIGLVFGTSVYHKADPTRVMLRVMILSVISNLLDTIVFASFFGYNLTETISQTQTMMNSIFESAGVAIPDGLLTTNYLMRLLVISMVILGLVQGYVIYMLTTLILRRLRFHLEKPKSIYAYYPNRIVGSIATIMTVVYAMNASRTFDNEIVENIFMTAGIACMFYLMFFGLLFLMLWLKTMGINSKILRLVIVVALYMFASIVIVAFGSYYILSDKHRQMANMVAEK